MKKELNKVGRCNGCRYYNGSRCSKHVVAGKNYMMDKRGMYYFVCSSWSRRRKQWNVAY